MQKHRKILSGYVAKQILEYHHLHQTDLLEESRVILHDAVHVATGAWRLVNMILTGSEERRSEEHCVAFEGRECLVRARSQTNGNRGQVGLQCSCCVCKRKHASVQGAHLTTFSNTHT